MAKGFNRPPVRPGGGGGMMGQMQKLQEQLAATQAALAEEVVSATAGGGAVSISVSGDQVCKEVKIDPEFLKEADAEMLQDMILTAFNLAIEKSRQLQSERLGPLAGGMPGLF